MSPSVLGIQSIWWTSATSKLNPFKIADEAASPEDSWAIEIFPLSDPRTVSDSAGEKLNRLETVIHREQTVNPWRTLTIDEFARRKAEVDITTFYLPEYG